MHWCLGLRGSGSTWVFNAVRKVALAFAPDKVVLGPYVTNLADLPGSDEIAQTVIVKSHETDNESAENLSKSAQAVWISIRDPRDCVTSLVQYHRLEFDTALRSVARNADFCARFTTHPNAHLFRYESGFADEPATLDIIAARFGGVLAVPDRERIFAETRRPAIEAFIEQLDKLPTAVRPSPGNLVDTVTKWHHHHANRTGEIGRWRKMLTPRQVLMIEQRLGPWMDAFDYPASQPMAE